MTAIHLRSCGGVLGAQDRRNAALDALSDATLWVLATLREWRRRSRDRAQLAALDRRLLADIGLTAGDRDFLVNKPFWKE